MIDLSTLLTERPATVDGTYFFRLASTLLEKTFLMVAGTPHRFTEVEFYYHGGEHPDPFAHCDPMQKTNGRWYFHRDGGEYRGGTFKGLDISFGPEDAFGGILIRTITAPDGTEINGCSLTVDHLLAQTGHPDIASLDAAIAERRVWDTSSPLHLVTDDSLSAQEILSTARVGLTLKRAYQHHEMPRYIMRDYRYLTDRKIKKGKLHTIIALHKKGHPPEEIKRLTGSPLKSIQEYIENFQAGLQVENFKTYRGKSLENDELCRLHGTWHKHYVLDREEDT